MSLWDTLIPLDTTGQPINQAYHKSWTEAAQAGTTTIAELVQQVTSRLQVSDFDTAWEKIKSDLTAGGPAGIGTVVDLFNSTPIRVTDVTINRRTGTYGLGFGFDLSGTRPHLAGITLGGFGVKMQRRRAPPANAA